jgi:Xaa-Pro aminopeptidase
VVVRGATEDEVPYGLAARYRQNSSFFYLTGVDAPGAFLVLLPGGLSAAYGLRKVPAEVREILFLPARDPAVEVWTGPKLGPGEEAERLTGIAKVTDVGRFWGAVTNWLRVNPVCYTLTPYGESARGTHEYALMRRLADQAPVVQFRDASPAVARLRVVRSPAEVDRIRRAIQITAEGQRAARAMLATVRDGGPALREYDV